MTMEILKTNSDKTIQPVLIGLLLNLTHLDNYNYKVNLNNIKTFLYVTILSQFPDNMVDDLNLFGIQYMEHNNSYKSYINLISIMINIVRKSSNNRKITDYEKCSFIDCLLEKYNMHIDIASICIKFIKKVSKIYSKYSQLIHFNNINLYVNKNHF